VGLGGDGAGLLRGADRARGGPGGCHPPPGAGGAEGVPASSRAASRRTGLPELGWWVVGARAPGDFRCGEREGRVGPATGLAAGEPGSVAGQGGAAPCRASPGLQGRGPPGLACLGLSVPC